MKKHLIHLLWLPLILLMTACGERRETLFVFNWAEYIDPDLIRQFEREHNVRVRIDTFDSNESMYAKIRAGAGGYDLIFPSGYMALLMYQEGLLQPIPHDLIPNIGNIDPNYLSSFAMDPVMRYSVPYMMVATGIGYRGDRISDMQPTWAVFDRADLAGRMMLLNDMRETIGAALKFLGYSLNTTNVSELEQARDVILRWRNNVAKFDNEAYRNDLASGSFWVAHGYSGDIRMIMDDEPAVRFILPKEGFAINTDYFVIPHDARNVPLAAKFINFLLDGEVAAQNMEYVYYLAPNKAAIPFLSPETLADEAIFIPEEKLKNAEFIRDLGEDNQLYIRIWDQIRRGN